MTETLTAKPTAQVKLVIWDLDETLWAGVLSEGASRRRSAGSPSSTHLVDRGVMVSVSSRNDHDAARAALERTGCGSSSSSPGSTGSSKGAQVRDLIEAAQLRPQNVLFADDNHLNRAEAAYFAPGLQVADPAEPGFDALIDGIAAAGKPDPDHRTARRVPPLETRREAATTFDDNLEFLRSSGTSSSPRTGRARGRRPDPRADRADEPAELHEARGVGAGDIAALLADPATTARTVRVTDRFGDYGLVGFVAVRDGEVVQLAFSCRILGMGVERAVYERLGRPRIAIAEPVSAPLEGEPTTGWRSARGPRRRPGRMPGPPRPSRPPPGPLPAVRRAPSARSILFVGGCDLQSTIAFLDRPDGVATHFNYSPPDRPRLTVHRDSIDFLLSDTWPVGAREAVLADAPFLDPDVFRLPDWSAFDHIVYSPLIDYVQAKYVRPDLPGVVPVLRRRRTAVDRRGADPAPERARPDRRGRACAGLRNAGSRRSSRTTSGPASSRLLLERMRHAASVTILLGATHTFDGLDTERLATHRAANALIREVAAAYPNTHLVEVDPLLHARTDFADGIRHYSRRVYRDLALAVSSNVALDVRESAARTSPPARPRPAARSLAFAAGSGAASAGSASGADDRPRGAQVSGAVGRRGQLRPAARPAIAIATATARPRNRFRRHATSADAGERPTATATRS